MDTECRECELSVRPYKQVIQEDPDLCEFCALAAMGLEEFPLEEDIKDEGY